MVCVNFFDVAQVVAAKCEFGDVLFVDALAVVIVGFGCDKSKVRRGNVFVRDWFEVEYVKCVFWFFDQDVRVVWLLLIRILWTLKHFSVGCGESACRVHVDNGACCQIF